uniref:Putative asparagine synthetase [glutamine-hydrolyzing] n=1 Tax=uncultured marine thaumarchaeote KM3_02_B09 TaxID=1455956 RepID=A0A075G6X6_9ARCH|nr:asparagine synthase (glutamine-hydrolyzing) (asnB, ASNS) [uncultured marine thaumarchaeote KM3_02_B09]
MCGVFAIFLHRPLTDADIQLGRQGVAALGHRGPDGSGEWMDRGAGVYIGHARLAIIDPSSASDQPMARDGLVLAYNGEIYNFRELRENLASQHDFRTTGDVEVMLRAWQSWGEGALDRMDGMFGAVVWDGRRAHLAVDVFGEKPLVYATISNGIIVCSELAPLVRLLGLTPHIPETLWPAYLSLGYLPAPDTSFPTVTRLPPASVLSIEDGRAGSLRRYWSPPSGEPGTGRVQPLGETGLDELSNALITSLRRRLIADVPLAAFLSAGVDSSLVVALSARELGVLPTCLTVSFADSSLVDEAPAARRIAEYLGTELRVLSAANFTASQTSADALLDLYGEPTENIAVFPIMQVSQAAAESFKASLTGFAGDEVTSGYAKHAHFYDRRAIYDAPESLRVFAGNLAAPVAFMSSRIAAMAHLYGVRDSEVYLAQKNAPAISWLRRIPGFESWARDVFCKRPEPPAIAVPRFERDEVMPNAHLIASDLGSMHYGLELRTPFLSRDVVETIAQFDPRAMVAFGQKSVLRRILARYLPARLIDFPKSGFTFPADKFLSNCGQKTPSQPGLNAALAREAWSQRFEGHGWSRIAIRLAVASRFFERQSGAAAAN